MNNKTCFFIGSRHSSSDIREQLVEAIEKHIVEYTPNESLVGISAEEFINKVGNKKEVHYTTVSKPKFKKIYSQK